MRVRDLPPLLVERLVALDDHAQACAAAAAQADAKLAECRATLAGNFAKTGRMREDLQVFEQAKANFDSILKVSQEARRIADAAMRTASAVKVYIDTLPVDSRLDPVEEPKANGADLSAVKARVAELRVAINKIRNAPMPADRERLAVWFDPGRREAAAELDRLLGRYPHFLAEPITRDTMIAVMTMLLPYDAALDHLCERIDGQANAVLPPSARPGRIVELESQLGALLALESAFINKAIEAGDCNVTHDPQVPPQVVLGARLRNGERN